MTLGTRLKQARLKKKLTQEKLAKVVGIKQQAVQRIEAGKVRSTSYIVQLAKALEISPDWLALGEGTDTVTSNHMINEPTATYNANSHSVPLLDWHDIPAMQQPKSSSSKVSYPTYNLNNNPGFALEIKDNSMTRNDNNGVSFSKGDIIIVQAQNTAQENDFVLVKFENSSQVSFRQFIKQDNGAELVALNSKYNTTRFTPEVKICGVVVARYTSLRPA